MHEKTKELRGKMIEHLQAALALAEEANDSTVGFVIETAIRQARADQWAAPETRPLFSKASADPVEPLPKKD